MCVCQPETEYHPGAILPFTCMWISLAQACILFFRLGALSAMFEISDLDACVPCTEATCDMSNVSSRKSLATNHSLQACEQRIPRRQDCRHHRLCRLDNGQKSPHEGIVSSSEDVAVLLSRKAAPVLLVACPCNVQHHLQAHQAVCGSCDSEEDCDASET